MMPTVGYRALGRTGLQVSELAMGCGPISNLMTGENSQRQVAVLRRALECGINWIDTAATYGQGRSEKSLGLALRELRTGDEVHLATKVRLAGDELNDISGAVRRSLEGSLSRLGRSHVALLQVHNAITLRRGDEATSLTPADVLGTDGVLRALEKMRSEGLVKLLGLTAVGHRRGLLEVIDSQAFDTIQVPYNLVNPSAGMDLGDEFGEADYGNIIARAGQYRMGVFAIRVFAAGALLGLPPASHTRASPFFPLDLYRRDEQRAAKLRNRLGSDADLHDLAVRFSLQHPSVNSAIIGFGEPSHVDQAAVSARQGPLSKDAMTTIGQLACL
jgi:aryl-alcohol dehydrogenase-like predicted oxidoreductase